MPPGCVISCSHGFKKWDTGDQWNKGLWMYRVSKKKGSRLRSSMNDSFKHTLYIGTILFAWNCSVAIIVTICSLFLFFFDNTHTCFWTRAETYMDRRGAVYSIAEGALRAFCWGYTGTYRFRIRNSTSMPECFLAGFSSFDSTPSVTIFIFKAWP